jgi:hypothetical protein
MESIYHKRMFLLLPKKQRQSLTWKAHGCEVYEQIYHTISTRHTTSGGICRGGLASCPYRTVATNGRFVGAAGEPPLQFAFVAMAQDLLVWLDIEPPLQITVCRGGWRTASTIRICRDGLRFVGVAGYWAAPINYFSEITISSQKNSKELTLFNQGRPHRSAACP